MTDVHQYKVAQFVEKHGIGQEQFNVLIEEVGELAELVGNDDLGDGICSLVSQLGNTAETLHRNGNSTDIDWSDVSDEELAEELADVVFVARALAEMRDINVTERLNEVAEENLQKDFEMEGDKITKSGLPGDYGKTGAESTVEIAGDDEFHITDWDSYEYRDRVTYVDGEIPDDFVVGGSPESPDWEVENVSVDVFYDATPLVTVYPPGADPWESGMGDYIRRHVMDSEAPTDVATRTVEKYVSDVEGRERPEITSQVARAGMEDT